MSRLPAQPYGRSSASTPRHQPGSQPTRSGSSPVVCGNCQTANPGDRVFCSSCGNSLWAHCVNCNAECSTSETFCGSCGGNLRELEEELRGALRRQLNEARGLFSELKLDEAVVQLNKLKRLQHPCVASLYEERGALLEQIKVERNRYESEQPQTLQDAQRMLEDNRHERALKLLISIPEAVRCQEVKRLLQDLQDRREAIAQLKQEIQTQSNQLRAAELGMKIEALLALVPQDKQARDWATQFQQKVLKTTKSLAAQFRFSQARALIEQTPSICVDDNVRALTDQVVELDWLATELKLAPETDARLLEAVQRLTKAVPQFTPGKEALRRIHDQAVRDGKVRRTRWAASPQETAVAMKVEPLRGQPFAVAQGGNVLGRHLPRMLVSIGLALQGLGQSPITTNLMPPKSGMLDKLGLGSGNKSAKTAWGIDLSNSAIKAVKMGLDKQGVVQIEDAILIPHEMHLERPEARDSRNAIIHRTLHKLLQQHKPTPQDKVVVSWPSIRMLGRFISLPPLKGKRFREAVKYEAQHQIPFDLADVVWTYHDLADRKNDPGTCAELAFFIAKRQEIEQHLFPFETAELRVDILQADCVALHNYLAQALFGGSDPSHAANVCLLDVGSATTNLLISGPEVFWFRSLRLGGDMLTESIARGFRLTFQQAEQLKMQPARAERLSELDIEMSTTYQRLVGEIQRSMQTFREAHGGRGVDQLYGTGGSFQCAGLWRHLLHGR